ncbi:hypothetical protein ANCDUO_07174 [Ancylostoma duodenale]|uniref:7TM GPCR serpentine receptor class x (Srx) domain-containing protein n=1 Tax=Ancylostoma duodenale TaxID=51022 RepID=A0A0C2DJ66_9BILA|nr:hypothetical protein ANCDUO_07174 [Ancylostoma duodenale]
MPNISGECNLLYSDSAWVFMFRATERCGFISWYFDFGQDFAVVVFIAVIDTITIIKVRLTSAEIQKSGCRITTSKRTRDVTFLKQAVAQGIIFAVELYTYFFLGWEFTNKWMIFLFTTVAWNVVHCCDPIIIIVFNKEFRRLVCAPLRRSLREWLYPHYDKNRSQSSNM